jgi:hypothetical protein
MIGLARASRRALLALMLIAPGAVARARDIAPRASCGSPVCSGWCTISSERGPFRLSQPDQVAVSPPGWTIIVPPLPPPPPAPGATPNPSPPVPWKPVFYDNDFRYVDDPDSPYRNTFDFLKRRRPFGDAVVTSFGGEFRWQGRGEDNRRLTGEQNNFNLFRERLYLDTWFDDRFRIYGEVHFADASEQTVPPIFNDLDHGDTNNLFGELKLYEAVDGWWNFRYGWKEELLFGNQRMVSPLDWANVRRTFAMVPHLFHRGENWNVDLFWSRPNIILARQFNQPNYEQQFFGSYLTYKGTPNRLYDLYYLGLLSDRDNTVPLNGEVGEYQVHTLGLRYQGAESDWLWEGEAAYQFGGSTSLISGDLLSRSAGMATAGFGRKLARLPFTPELWFYYDYASGNRGPGAGSFNRFNQLFPLGHKYLGYMDVVARQNILSPNVNLKFYLGKRAQLLLWYYNFQLASARDGLFTAGGALERIDPTGRAGRDVGNELDVVLTVFQNPNTEWQFGLAHLWAGSFIQRTAATPAQAQDSNFFYTQFTFRF